MIGKSVDKLIQMIASYSEVFDILPFSRYWPFKKYLNTMCA